MIQFRLFGFPIQIHWMFWLGAAVLGGAITAQTPAQWQGIAVWVSVVLVSIIVHELGHAFVGRKFGAHPSIVLHSLGGLTFLPGERFSRSQSILISLAGPLAGIMLGLVCLAVARAVPFDTLLAKQILRQLIYVNIVWSLFNLLPVLPMDGGQILRDILGPSRIRIARITGAVIAVILAVVAINLSQWFIAVFLGVLAFSNFKGSTPPGGVSTP